MEKEWNKREGATFWNPTEKDDEVIGVIVDIIDGDFGNQYVIEKSDNKKITTSSHKALQSLMQGMEKGDQVKIVYVGEKEAEKKGHSPTKLYEVYD